jgi:hypothetical protein
MALFLTLLYRFKNQIFYERKRMKKLALFLTDVKNSSLFDEFVCKLGLFTRVLKWPIRAKKGPIYTRTS